MKTKYLLYGLVVLRLILPFLLQDEFYQPHRDAYLYLDYAHHMSWGYMEVPPLLSVFSWISLQFGNGVFWTKWWPAFFGSLSLLLCGKMLIHLGGKYFSLVLLFFSFTFSAYLRVFFLFQPGFLEVFSWISITYCIFRFQQTKQTHWFLLLGLVCGLGMLSKYTTAFFLIAVCAGILLSKERVLFTYKVLYAGVVLGFIVFLPNIIWQFKHKLPVIHHMAELRETQLIHMDSTSFLVDQLMNNFPVFIIWMTGLIALLFLKNLRPFRWYAFSYFFLLILFILTSGKGYYALGIYPVLFVFGAFTVEQFSFRFHWVLKTAIVSIILYLGIFSIPILLPVFKPEKLAAFYEKKGIKKAMGFKWEDQQNHPLPQDFADMIGWQELAEMTARQYNNLPDSSKSKTMIYCRGYFTAGAINFYGKKYGLPEVYSDNGSYLQWIPDTFPYQNLMMVGKYFPDDTDIVFKQFEKNRTLDSLDIPLFRENKTKVFLFENAKDSMSVYAEQGIKKMKQQFNL